MDTLSLKRDIEHFLAEDVGLGDITSEAIFSPKQIGEAIFVAKDSFLIAGIEEIAPIIFTTRNPDIRCSPAKDGSKASPGDLLLTLQGPVLDLLAAERVALNIVQRLCGIATLTQKFVKEVSPLPAKIVDTRKTTPGLRVLEKYAVRVGGGHNHRFNLADGILIKDNHIAACGSIEQAVLNVRKQTPHTLKIEVETTTLDQVETCLQCGVDIIMLDNMNLDMMHEAVKLAKGKALLEASGGVSLENVRDIAKTGVDIISIGALTHSAPAVDISMRFNPAK